jgi:excisionase family DNA binding protein
MTKNRKRKHEPGSCNLGALTVDAAAGLLSTHPGTIRRMIREGSLHAVRLGRGSRSPYRIPKHEIERFLSNGSRGETD